MELYNSALQESSPVVRPSPDDDPINTASVEMTYSLANWELPSHNQPYTAEQRLAVGIILQAIRDYIMYINDPTSILGLDALWWFTEDSEDAPFRLMCQALDLDPTSILDTLESLATAYTMALEDANAVSTDVYKVLKQLGVL